MGYSTKNIGKQFWAGAVLLVITLSIFVILPLVCGVNKEFVLSVKQPNVVGQVSKRNQRVIREQTLQETK